MAHHKSAKKAIRQNTKRQLLNRSRKNRIRTYIKKVEEAITSGNRENAQESLRVAQPELMVGVNKGVFKLNTISRKISRLAKKIKLMSA